MPLPPKLQEKFLKRFDELIAEGDAIYKAIQFVQGRVHIDEITEEQYRDPDFYIVDWQSVVKWRASCVALLSQIVAERHVLWDSVKLFSELPNAKDRVEWGISTLKAIREDFERGFLGDLLIQVEAEVAADYMGHAEGLLREGQKGKYDHVPGAVLAGAVLEKALRTLCLQQHPAIPATKSDGDPKTLNPLIDDLKKAGVFNEAKAKQLRAWADVRNHAAHGEFDQFTRADVEQMISGINNFLADYLK